MNRRTAHIKVLVTNAEREILERAAATAGAGISTWIRVVALEMARTQIQPNLISIKAPQKIALPKLAEPKNIPFQRKTFELLPAEPGKNLNGQKLAKLRKDLDLRFEIVAMRLGLTKMNIYGIERGLLVPQDESAWGHWMNWIRCPSPLEETDIIPSKDDRLASSSNSIPDRRAHTRYL